MSFLPRLRLVVVCAACLVLLAPGRGLAATSEGWVTSWVASAHGPYPSGSAAAQPDLTQAFPSETIGARDQSIRIILRPHVWGSQARLRFSNAFGTHPVVLDDLFVGVQSTAATLLHRTNRPVTFGGSRSVTLMVGAEVWSDPVSFPEAVVQAGAWLEGRKLAVSFHVMGESGPMTWHAKAMQTSYLSLPGAGSHGSEENEASFPYPTTSCYFVDALDMKMRAAPALVVCLGDSITDGTNSTLNGDDRWPDQLQRRFDAAFPSRVCVVDAGIGGNQIAGPASYSADQPFSGGPSALDRLSRDVLELSGVKTVLWFEGINDLSHAASAADVIAGLRKGVARLHEKLPGVRLVGATITPSLGAKGVTGLQDQDNRRQAVNAFIRTGGLFDAVLDFEKAVIDPATGRLRADMNFNTTIGGPGDNLHPNRAGYLAIAQAIDLKLVLPELNTP